MSDPASAAFPAPQRLREDGEVIVETQFGLTKRELFAAMAMQGILACAYKDMAYEHVAREAVMQTDRLLKMLDES